MNSADFARFLDKALTWNERAHSAVQQQALERANERNDFHQYLWPMVLKARAAVEEPKLYTLSTSVAEDAPRGELKVTPTTILRDHPPRTYVIKVFLERGTVSFASDVAQGNASAARAHVTEEWVLGLIQGFVIAAFNDHQLHHQHLL